MGKALQYFPTSYSLLLSVKLDNKSDITASIWLGSVAGALP